MPWEFPSPSPHLLMDLSHQARNWELSECASFPPIIEKCCFLVLKLGGCTWGTMWMESPERSYFTLVVCIMFSFLENTEICSIPPPPATIFNFLLDCPLEDHLVVGEKTVSRSSHTAIVWLLFYITLLNFLLLNSCHGWAWSEFKSTLITGGTKITFLCFSCMLWTGDNEIQSALDF